MGVAEVKAGHRRITILRLLYEDEDHASNASVLATAMGEVANLFATREQVIEDLAHLEEHGAVEREDLGGVIAVSLTDKGVMAATGRITIPGVQRPRRKV